jgi:hypothetical protein
MAEAVRPDMLSVSMLTALEAGEQEYIAHHCRGAL